MAKPEKKTETPTLVLSRQDPNRILVKKSKLLVTSGAFKGREFMVDKDVFAIGAGPYNDLVVDDSTVSRRHCEIQLMSRGYLIRDLGSTNGTVVEGVRVAHAYLEQGTEFRLGETTIVFRPLEDATTYTLSSHESFGQMLGRSAPMRRVFHLSETYAPTDATVLIEGETGTGKEILAEEIHRHSPRRDKPFIVIDCAALAKDLVASELFGHNKGAFTGANIDRVGAFEHANGGTVLLDEIGDLSLDLQPKLLRVLEKRQIRRVGSNQVRTIDVRIISATNRKLENEVNASRFREDLFFRLSVVHLELPPLRKRKDDIILLCEKFLKDFHGEHAMQRVADFDRTRKLLLDHDWPGNVRELRNVVEIASYGKRDSIDLGAFLYLDRMRTSKAVEEDSFPTDRPFKEAKGELIRVFEQRYLRDLLERHGGNVSRAAREAGIERAYLQRLIRKHGMRA